jgi:hypothetical protein
MLPQRPKAFPGDNESLLDATLAFFVSGTADGSQHSPRNLPVLIAGDPRLVTGGVHHTQRKIVCSRTSGSPPPEYGGVTTTPSEKTAQPPSRSRRWAMLPTGVNSLQPGHDVAEVSHQPPC